MTKKSNSDITNTAKNFIAGSNRAVSRPSSSPGAADVKPYGAYLEFKNNMPVPRYNPPPDGVMTKQVMHSRILQTLSEPFNGTIRDPVTDEVIELNMPEMIGRPMGEVLIRVFTSKAMLGDQKAFDAIMDRAYGKPAQETTNINIDATETYEQFLEKVAAEENIDLCGGDVIDVEAEQAQQDDDLDTLLEDF